MSSAARVLSLPLLLLSLLAVAPTATAAEDWLVAPSGGGRPSFYTEGEPGSVQQDTVSVTNRGAEPVTVRLTGDGVPIAFAESRVRIPARTRAEVPFTVTVPTGTAPGDRSGEIVARDADGRAQRVALRLRVTGPELTALTVEQVAVRADGITYVLVNRGTTPSRRVSRCAPTVSSAASWTAPRAPCPSTCPRAAAPGSPSPGPTGPRSTRSTCGSRSRRRAGPPTPRRCRCGSCRGARWRGPRGRSRRRAPSSPYDVEGAGARTTVGRPRSNGLCSSRS